MEFRPPREVGQHQHLYLSDRPMMLIPHFVWTGLDHWRSGVVKNILLRPPLRPFLKGPVHADVTAANMIRLVVLAGRGGTLEDGPLSSLAPTVGPLSQAVGRAGSLGNGPNFPLLAAF
jgi:hypothetical protein